MSVSDAPTTSARALPNPGYTPPAPRLAPPETVPAVPGGGRQIEVCAHLILRQKFLECPQAIRNWVWDMKVAGLRIPKELCGNPYVASTQGRFSSPQGERKKPMARAMGIERK